MQKAASVTTTFRDVVSGRRSGVAAAALRCGLRVAELPYAWVVQQRNRAYDTGRREIYQAGVPVISVGNLTLGGTGKTPMVAWLAEWFGQRGTPVAIVSRGYGAKTGASNDEARELHEKLPDVPHVQNPDRVAAAHEAIASHRCRVIVLDDGFQHRRLARDLDIVLIDALEPFGFEHVFPRGMLREPLDGLARADIVALSRADAISPEKRNAIRNRVARLAPDADWIELVHRPVSLLNASGASQPVAALRGRQLAAFCGIGNPAGFRHTLEGCGCDVVAWRELPDHFDYQAADIAALGRWLGAAGVDLAACTHKDLVKVQQDDLSGVPLWAVTVSTEISAGKATLLSRLQALSLPMAA